MIKSVWALAIFNILSFAMDLPTVRKLYAKDFSELGVEYSEQQVIDEAIDTSKILVADPRYETGANSARFTTAIKNGHQASLYLKYINDRVGYGTFADALIQEDDIVGEYTGKIIRQHIVFAMRPEETVYLMPLQACYADYYCLTSLYINAKQIGNFTRFINHSDKPNVISKQVYDGSMWHMILVASQNILQDKQLFIDYGTGYWEARGIKPIDLQSNS